MAGLSLSLFMLGFAAGQFTGGRGSDLIGRRPVLLISLTVYILSGICCAFATTGPGLVAARLIQGAGAGACAVQANAMVQDLFHGEEARRRQSYISVVLTIMPMLAPAFGTVLVANFGWRSVHLVLALGGILLATIVTLFVAESRLQALRTPSKGLGLAESRTILQDGVFRRLAVVNALSYGAIFAYICGAPVIVMDELGHPPIVYAALFAATALSLSSGAFSNALLARRGICGERLIWPGLVAQASSTIGLVLAGGRIQTSVGAGSAILTLLVCTYARGLLSPNLVHFAVSRHRKNAGLASALVGLIQLTVGAAASAFVAALLSRFGYTAVSVSMAVLACAAATVWRMTEGAERVGRVRRAD